MLVEEQGFEPWAFRMQSGRSATELHPLPINIELGRRAGTSFDLSVVAAMRSMITKIEMVTPWNLSVRIDAGKPASAV